MRVYKHTRVHIHAGCMRCSPLPIASERHRRTRFEEETPRERASGHSQLVGNNMLEYSGHIHRAADIDGSMYICLERKRT